MSKLIAIVLLISFTAAVFLPAFANQAQAQWVVFDPANFGVNTVTAINTTLQSPVKEFSLDTIAWLIVNIFIERIAASTVKWINNGFRGSPAFVTNPEAYFRGLSNKIAGQVIYNHKDLDFMCAPLRARVQIALTNSYNRPFGNFRCSLGQIENNFDGFMNDFYQGGWDGFIELSQHSQNNPIGLYNQVLNEVNVSIGSARGLKEQELLQGKGFLAWKSCALWSDPVPGYTSGGGAGVTGVIDDQGNLEYAEKPPVDVSGVPAKCLREQVNTPGTVIEGQLNDVLGIGNDRLQVADEINEIISALLNQLVSKALGAIGSGLRGLTSPSSGRTTTPVPTSGTCPLGYTKISATECLAPGNAYAEQLQDETYNNNNIDELKAQVGETQNELENTIAESEAAGQNLPPPPSTQCLIDPNAAGCQPAATCPSGSVVLGAGSIFVGQSTTASAPSGWSGGTFASNDPQIATVSGTSVTGTGPGNAFIDGDGWTASNGAGPCSLFGDTLIVF